MSPSSAAPTPENDEAPVSREVAAEEDRTRLDAFLVSHFGALSRARIQRAIAAGRAAVDGQVVKASFRLSAGQTVAFRPPADAPAGPVPEDIPVEVLYEDEHLVAINKPAGMVVHPAKGHWAGTLTSAISHRFGSLSSLGGATRPGIVHRLDRDTSGVIVVARTDQAHAALASQFEQRTVQKRYWTIVSPAPDRDRDLIDQPIGAHPYQREKKAIRHHHASSRQAESFYEVQERLQGFAVLHVLPRTGRTHQIRVHMAHIGCPVLCDRLYSGRARLAWSDLDRRRTAGGAGDLILERQALHALELHLTHPVTGTRLEFRAPLPPDLVATLEAIRQCRPQPT